MKVDDDRTQFLRLGSSRTERAALGRVGRRSSELGCEVNVVSAMDPTGPSRLSRFALYLIPETQ